MDYLELSLRDDPHGASLDPHEAVRRVSAAFPEIDLLPGDPLASKVEVLERLVEGRPGIDPSPSARPVLESARRFSETCGPAYQFRIPQGDGKHLRGRIHRYQISFFGEADFDRPLMDRILNLLKSFGCGEIGTISEDGQLVALE